MRFRRSQAAAAVAGLWSLKQGLLSGNRQLVIVQPLPGIDAFAIPEDLKHARSSVDRSPTIRSVPKASAKAKFDSAVVQTLLEKNI